jgi:hypothetical protein
MNTPVTLTQSQLDVLNRFASGLNPADRVMLREIMDRASQHTWSLDQAGNPLGGFELAILIEIKKEINLLQDLAAQIRLTDAPS